MSSRLTPETTTSAKCSGRRQAAVLARVAKMAENEPEPAVRATAIQWLGQTNDDNESIVLTHPLRPDAETVV